MAIQRFRRFLKGVILRENTSDPVDASEGALFQNSTDQRMKAFIEGQSREIVTEDQAQTLENKIIDADDNTISNIDNDEIKANAGIDATKIADGSVSNAEFQALDGITSSIQTQLDSKMDIDGIDAGTNVTITGSGTSADPYIINASGGGGGANTTLSNLTSPTAINQALLPSGSIDVGASSNRFANIYATDINANTTLVGPSISSSVSSVAISQDLNAQTNSIINLADPTNPQDAATKAYVDSQVGSSLVVQQNGSTIVSSASTLNFVSGATIVDGGSGEAEITITGGSSITGTPNTIAKFNGTGDNVQDSSITDNGSVVEFSTQTNFINRQIYFDEYSGTNPALFVHTGIGTSNGRSLAIGYNALSTSTTAIDNVALGHSSLALATGPANTAIGNSSLSANTIGSSNTALGYSTLASNDNGSSNTAIGSLSSTANTSGESNTAIGESSLGTNTAGSYNVAIGRNALGAYNATIGIAGYNVAIGRNAGSGCTGNSNANIFIGASSGPTGSGVVSQKLYINPSDVASNTPLIYGDGSNNFVRFHNSMQLPEAAAPSTPASGYGTFYVKSDGLAYFKNDGGTEFLLSVAGGGANTALSNLGTTSINANLLPSAVDTISLGNATTSVSAVYTNTLLIKPSSGDQLTIGTNATVPSATTPNHTIRTFQTPLILMSSNRAGVTNSDTINLETGNTLNGNSGDINLRTGVPSGSGVRGKVVVNATSIRIPSLASDPSGGVAADMYYNTTTNKMKFYNGTTWETITSA